MSRLQSELQRLYLLPTPGGAPGDVRALVMELAGPADWSELSRVWRGVQVELDLPAPGIAVSGTDGLQLWFSLQAPVDASRAAAFLAQLQSRYLPGVAAARLRLMPSAEEPTRRAAPVPAPQAGTENWSAFVAPDLAPVFGDTPWLDIPPGSEGQADLLAKLDSIKPAAFEALVPPAARTAGLRQDGIDPRHFLQQVLNDETAPLALRVEAAAALLRAG